VTEAAAAAEGDHVLRRTLSNLGLRALMRLSSRREYRGLTLVLLNDPAPEAVTFNKLLEALDLIFDHDARSAFRVSRYLSRVVVTHADGSYGWYWHNLRACFLDPGYVAEHDSSHIAMTIVHEATHARVRQLFDGCRDITQSRIEALCVDAEISFARRLGNAEPLIEDATRRLQRWIEPSHDSSS